MIHHVFALSRPVARNLLDDMTSPQPDDSIGIYAPRDGIHAAVQHRGDLSLGHRIT